MNSYGLVSLTVGSLNCPQRWCKRIANGVAMDTVAALMNQR